MSTTTIIERRKRYNELPTYRRILETYPSGIVSVVSDTYNLWSVITDVLPRLKEQILARDGKLVIRPDSGDPADILCGGYEVAADWQQDWEEIQAGKPDTRTPAQKGVIELLWETFGGTVNEKGYKTLDPHIGAIYGDSITVERAENIFRRLAAKGFASDNIVFGAGSYFYQGNTTRDTFGSAMKATWVQIDNEGLDILKDPVTDNGTKKSATGRLAVLRDENDELVLVQQATAEQEADSELATVWKDGAFVREQSFADVRAVLKDEVKRVYR